MLRAAILFLIFVGGVVFRTVGWATVTVNVVDSERLASVLGTAVLGELKQEFGNKYVIYEVAGTTQVAKSPVAVQERLLDFENYCLSSRVDQETGQEIECKYLMPSVIENQVYFDDDRMYVWSWVKAAIFNDYAFIGVSSQDHGDGSIDVEMVTPTKQRIKELSGRGGVGHSTNFGYVNIVWRMVVNDAKPEVTDVSISGFLVGTKWGSRNFQDSVKSSVTESTELTMEHLKAE